MEGRVLPWLFRAAGGLELRVMGGEGVEGWRSTRGAAGSCGGGVVAPQVNAVDDVVEGGREVVEGGWS